MPEPIRDRIQREALGNFEPLIAHTAIKAWGTASKPVLVACNDCEQYVIKGSQNGRMLYNEYVCGRLGNLLSAPVAWVRFVEVPVPLRVGELAHFGPGLALGSLRMPQASERGTISHVDVPQNRSGFASLAVLYSWCRASDHQLLYKEVPPHEVLSNDHGHFFPAGPGWSPASLNAHAAVDKDSFFDPCGLIASDFAPYWPLLNAITDADIHMITHAAPADWDVDQQSRDALFNYLASRRALVQAAF